MLTINYSKFYYSPMPRLLIIPALSWELAGKDWSEDGGGTEKVFLRVFSQGRKVKNLLFVEFLLSQIKVSFDNLEQKEVTASRNESNLSLIFDKICILFFICSEETHMNASLRDLLELDHIFSSQYRASLCLHRPTLEDINMWSWSFEVQIFVKYESLNYPD